MSGGGKLGSMHPLTFASKLGAKRTLTNPFTHQELLAGTHFGRHRLRPQPLEHRQGVVLEGVVPGADVEHRHRDEVPETFLGAALRINQGSNFFVATYLRINQGSNFLINLFEPTQAACGCAWPFRWR